MKVEFFQGDAHVGSASLGDDGIIRFTGPAFPAHKVLRLIANGVAACRRKVFIGEGKSFLEALAHEFRNPYLRAVINEGSNE